MYITLIAVLPVLLLMVIGNLLRRSGFLNDAFWQQVEKLIFYVLFPALLIIKIASVDLSQYDISSLLLFFLCFLLALTFVTYILCKLCQTQLPQHGSVYQSMIRFNSYMFFAIINELWGAGYLAIAALVAGLFIPIVNVLSVTGYAKAAGDTRFYHAILAILKNPFIIAAFIGFVFNQNPYWLPEFAFATLEIISRATLPLALLCVGAAVRVSLFSGKTLAYSKTTLILITLARLMLAPCICIALFWVFEFSLEMKQILIILAAVPTATSAHILAQRMHGDSGMMVALVSLQTMLSAFSLLFWVYISFYIFQ